MDCRKKILSALTLRTTKSATVDLLEKSLVSLNAGVEKLMALKIV